MIGHASAPHAAPHSMQGDYDIMAPQACAPALPRWPAARGASPPPFPFRATPPQPPGPRSAPPRRARAGAGTPRPPRRCQSGRLMSPQAARGRHSSAPTSKYSASRRSCAACARSAGRAFGGMRDAPWAHSPPEMSRRRARRCSCMTCTLLLAQRRCIARATRQAAQHSLQPNGIRPCSTRNAAKVVQSTAAGLDRCNETRPPRVPCAAA